MNRMPLVMCMGGFMIVAKSKEGDGGGCLDGARLLGDVMVRSWSAVYRIVRDLSANCPYFQEGCDAVGKAGISASCECTPRFRQLAYAAVPDSLDEYLQNRVIGEEYLRRPTQTDVEKLYAFHENKHGFPGSNNDVNVLRQSHVLNDLRVGKAPEVPFVA
ncbi:WAT1-related protein isoform X1 [Tanacetum coccineum]